jgi:hypothetical protein
VQRGAVLDEVPVVPDRECTEADQVQGTVRDHKDLLGLAQDRDERVPDSGPKLFTGLPGP